MACEPRSHQERPGKPGRGRWEAAPLKLEDNVEVEEMGREEEQVKVSILRDGGGARGGGPSVLKRRPPHRCYQDAGEIVMRSQCGVVAQMCRALPGWVATKTNLPHLSTDLST